MTTKVPRFAAHVLAAALLASGLGGCAKAISDSVNKKVDNAFSGDFGEKIKSNVTAPGKDLFQEGVAPLMAEFARILPDTSRVVSVQITGGAAQTARNAGAAVTTSGGVITIDVQQVKNPALVDEYTWSHELGFRGPKGTSDTGDTPLSERIFSLDDIDWSKMPAMGKTAVETAALPEAAASTLAVKKDFPGSPGKLLVEVDVSGDRGSGAVRFTPVGVLIGKLG